MAPLDFVAAQAVAQARLLERAVHDRGPWQIEVGDVRVPAVKVSTPSRVLFLAYFEQAPAGDVAWLHCRGELCSSMDIGDTGHGSCTIEWTVGTSDTVGV